MSLCPFNKRAAHYYSSEPFSKYFSLAGQTVKTTRHWWYDMKGAIDYMQISGCGCVEQYLPMKTIRFV